MTRTLAVLFTSVISLCAATPPADSGRGAVVFGSQSCIQCHALNGVGSRIGPDLGKFVGRGLTPATLTSSMWNHAPSMWAAIEQHKIQQPVMDEQASADLFAFFYSLLYFEEQGDAKRGQRLFDSRSCSTCHGTASAKNPAAKPTSQWNSLADPVAMIETMWNHAANMRDEMARLKTPWPQLTGPDVADLVAYLRNLPSGSPKRPGVFRTTTGLNGKALFENKGCTQCHKSGDQFLAAGVAGQTLTDVAAEMWNHPASDKLQFQPGEMRDVVSFIWSQRMFENTGNAARGKNVFADKNCAACHNNPSRGAPPLTSGRREFTDITMVSVLWLHGPSMLGRMREKLSPWPRFEPGEMSDLIAYLNARATPVALRPRVNTK
jgi:mono/diheme cytochrome c family protein